MKKLFKINNQWIYRGKDYLAFHIDQPWWGAGKRFGWDGPGIGINKKIIEKAKKMDLKLQITYYKNRKYRYEITPTLVEKRAKQYDSYYTARGKVKLLVIPVSSLKKLPIKNSRLKADKSTIESFRANERIPFC